MGAWGRRTAVCPGFPHPCVHTVGPAGAWRLLGAAGGITVERATSRGGDTNALLSQRLLTRLVPS